MDFRATQSWVLCWFSFPRLLSGPHAHPPFPGTWLAPAHSPTHTEHRSSLAPRLNCHQPSSRELLSPLVPGPASTIPLTECTYPACQGHLWVSGPDGHCAVLVKLAFLWWIQATATEKALRLLWNKGSEDEKHRTQESGQMPMASLCSKPLTAQCGWEWNGTEWNPQMTLRILTLLRWSATVLYLILWRRAG